MRVVIVMRSQSGVPGAAGVPGGQIGMIQLARALGRLGVDVHLFAGGPRMRYLDGLDGVRTSYLRWPVRLDSLIQASPDRLRRLGGDLRRRYWLRAVASLPAAASADVIHVQGLQDTELLLRRFDGPLVVTHWGRVRRWRLDGSDPDSRELLRRRIERIRANATVVAIGLAQGKELASVGLPPARVIPPGIDLDHFKPGDRRAARRRLGLPDGDGVVLYVGRLAADKNVETLLRAFARLPRSDRPARLLVVGDGPRRADLHALCRQLGLEAATHFLAFVPHQNLPAYYRACDVTVVPSDRLETFCMVALEAIACGCPLVVTDQVPEIIRRFPGVPAVAPYDLESLTDRLDAALHGRVPAPDPAGMAHYDWSGVAKRYLELYQTALRRAA